MRLPIHPGVVTVLILCQFVALGDAVDVAASQIGVPYVYGANGPASFDCSALTRYAYDQSGGPHLPPDLCTDAEGI